MKSAYMIALFVLTVGFKSAAQGNLQFNQVFSTAGATSSTNPGYAAYNSIAYSVPSGKVWKVEYAFGMNQGWYVTVNNNVMYYNNTTSQPLERTTPIWLKAGDILKFSSIYSTSNFYFSGIEFNVVP